MGRHNPFVIVMKRGEPAELKVAPNGLLAPRDGLGVALCLAPF